MSSDEKVTVRIRRPTVYVDDAPWHTTQAWWPTLEVILNRGHTVVVALFREIPSDVVGVKEDAIFGRYLDVTEGTGRARIFGRRASVADERASTHYMLATFPPGTHLPVMEDLVALFAASKAPQGIES